MRPGCSALPSGMPMRLPATQAIFRVRYGTQAASVVLRSTVRVVRLRRVVRAWATWAR